MVPPNAELTLTLYRSLMRSCRTLRAKMRPGHVVLVGECMNRFATTAAPELKATIRTSGPLPWLLVQHAFRQPVSPEQAGTSCARHADRAHAHAPLASSSILGLTASLRALAHTDDVAFKAMRGLNQISEYLELNNTLYDSLEHLSDREAPEQPNMSSVATAILRDAKISSESASS